MWLMNQWWSICNNPIGKRFTHFGLEILGDFLLLHPSQKAFWFFQSFVGNNFSDTAAIWNITTHINSGQFNLDGAVVNSESSKFFANTSMRSPKPGFVPRDVHVQGFDEVNKNMDTFLKYFYTISKKRPVIGIGLSFNFGDFIMQNSVENPRKNSHTSHTKTTSFRNSCKGSTKLRNFPTNFKMPLQLGPHAPKGIKILMGYTKLDACCN